MKRGILRSHRGLQLTLDQQVSPGRSAHAIIMLLRSSRGVYGIWIPAPPGTGPRKQEVRVKVRPLICRRGTRIEYRASRPAITGSERLSISRRPPGNGLQHAATGGHQLRENIG